MRNAAAWPSKISGRLVPELVRPTPPLVTMISVLIAAKWARESAVVGRFGLHGKETGRQLAWWFVVTEEESSCSYGTEFSQESQHCCQPRSSRVLTRFVSLWRKTSYWLLLWVDTRLHTDMSAHARI